MTLRMTHHQSDDAAQYTLISSPHSRAPNCPRPQCNCITCLLCVMPLPSTKGAGTLLYFFLTWTLFKVLSLYDSSWTGVYFWILLPIMFNSKRARGLRHNTSVLLSCWLFNWFLYRRGTWYVDTIHAWIQCYSLKEKEKFTSNMLTNNLSDDVSRKENCWQVRKSQEIPFPLPTSAKISNGQVFSLKIYLASSCF